MNPIQKIKNLSLGFFFLSLSFAAWGQKKQEQASIEPPGTLTFIAESNLYKARATFQEWEFTKLKFPKEGGLVGLTGNIEVMTNSVSERTIRVSNDLKTGPYLDTKKYPKALGKILNVKAGLNENQYDAEVEIRIKKYKKIVPTSFEVLSENPYRIKGRMTVYKEDFQVGMGDEMGTIKSEVIIEYETELRLSPKP